MNLEESLDITELSEGWPKKLPDGALRYKLFAAIYHMGDTPIQGHYHAYVHGPTGKWSSINDEIVEPVEFADVGGAQSKEDCVYVLAYRREPTIDRSATREGMHREIPAKRGIICSQEMTFTILL